MLYSPNTATTSDDRDILRTIMRRYAARYYLTGSDRDALVAQTVTALAEEPETLLDQPVEKAIAETMHRL